jgi:hypothetical protein
MVFRSFENLKKGLRKRRRRKVFIETTPSDEESI